mmetsp:Transcript_10958/g.22899  ORF Transcript_10958/g.22899 Transcript_10958/m.22899 type:complete len:397 (-) Transcript_10958:1325-2515(-)
MATLKQRSPNTTNPRIFAIGFSFELHTVTIRGVIKQRHTDTFGKLVLRHAIQLLFLRENLNKRWPGSVKGTICQFVNTILPLMNQPGIVRCTCRTRRANYLLTKHKTALVVFVHILAFISILIFPLRAKCITQFCVIQHIHILDNFVVTWVKALSQTHGLLTVRILEAKCIRRWSEWDNGLECTGRKHQVYMTSHMMVRVRDHEPVRLDICLAQIHEIGSSAMLRPHRHFCHEIIVVVCCGCRWHHHHNLRKWVVLVIQMLNKVKRTIEKPLRDYQCNFCLGRVPWGVQLGSVNNVFRTKMPWNQVCSGIVVNNRGVLEWVFLFPGFGPLCEHMRIVRQSDVFTFLVQHNLWSQFGDDSQCALYPHLRHAIVIRNGVVWTWGFDFQLTNKTFEQWM